MYWNDKCELLSNFLWLPSNNTINKLENKVQNLNSIETISNSWFKNEFHSLPFSNSIEPKNSITNPPVLRTRKIRVYPSSSQQMTLNLWFGTSRYIYNNVMELLIHDEQNIIKNKSWMTTKKFILNNLPDWSKLTPYQVKSIAVRDAFRNFKIKKLTFRSKHDPKQSIFIPKSSVSPEKGFYRTILGYMKHEESIPVPAGDGRLVCENGIYTLNMPFLSSVTTENQGRVVSIDPGIRNFLTFYSSDSCGKLGTGALSKIIHLSLVLNSMNEKLKTLNHHKRNNLKKAMNNVYWRINNLIDELIHKSSLFLVKNFDVIFIPYFSPKFNTNNEYLNNSINSVHKRFLFFLQQKANQYGKRISIQNEYDTTKICSWNGEKFLNDIHSKVIDKDLNAARNIMFVAMLETASHGKHHERY